MDCIEFNKKIDDYMKDQLTDEELNEFLHHVSLCTKCRNELEINVTVHKALDVLDNDDYSLDLQKVFTKELASGNKKLSIIKLLRIISYSIFTVSFWITLCAIIVFIRIMFL